jgi:hypothetical protein
MLKLALLQRSQWLQHELSVVRRSKPKTKLLYLSARGTPTDPARNIREQAFLIQQRLHLESQMESLRNT